MILYFYFKNKLISCGLSTPEGEKQGSSVSLKLFKNVHTCGDMFGYPSVNTKNKCCFYSNYIKHLHLGGTKHVVSVDIFFRCIDTTF